MVIGFRHTGIIVADMESSIRFYRDLLGMTVIQEFFDSSEYINTITGLKNGVARFVKLKMTDNTVLELLQYPSHPTEKHSLSIINIGVCHIALRVGSIVEVYEKLLANNVPVLSEPVLSSEGIAKVFFCLDPDSVRVEMVEMLDN